VEDDRRRHLLGERLDAFFKTAAVGAVAAAESDRNVVYAGMGESTIRGRRCPTATVCTARRMADGLVAPRLADTRHIGRVRVRPRDPDLV